MRRKIKIITLTGFILMFFVPLCITKLVRSDAGMAVCFILFFAVDPLFSIYVGIIAGKSLNESWYMPVIPVVIFVLSSWVVFDFFETAFIIYGAVYLIIGTIVMIICSSSLFKKNNNENSS